MSWCLYFRDHHHMAPMCILLDFQDILITINATIFPSITVVEQCPLGCDRFKLVIPLHLDPPSLVISKMPVESVQMVHGCYIYEFLDKGYREEVSAGIKHEPSPGEGRLIFYHAAGDDVVISQGHLPDGLQGTESPRGFARIDHYLTLPNLQVVCLFAHRCNFLEENVFVSYLTGQLFGGQGYYIIKNGVKADVCPHMETKRTFILFQVSWKRHQELACRMSFIFLHAIFLP